MAISNFSVLYLPNILGYYVPLLFLSVARRENLLQLYRFRPAVLHTILNLHFLLPLEVWILLHFYTPNPEFRWEVEPFLFMGCLILGEVWFYVTHRLFHSPFFFRHFHRHHHSITHSHALHSGYQHPVEFLTATMGTCFIGPIVLGCHNTTTFIWLFWMMTAGTVGHGGYFPGIMKWFKGHDHHHRYVNQNFGFLFLDNLFKTTSPKRRRTLSPGN